MRLQRLGASLVAGSLAVVLACGGKPDAPSPAATQPTAAVSASCESAAVYADRWPDFVAGGPTIGPVTIVMSPEVSRGSVTEPKHKMLILVAGDVALPGTTVRIWSESKGLDEPLLFSHGRNTEDDAFLPDVTLTAEPRGQGSDRPFDVPGWAIPRERGCYQISVEVDGEAYGPFGWNVV